MFSRFFSFIGIKRKPEQPAKAAPEVAPEAEAQPEPVPVARSIDPAFRIFSFIRIKRKPKQPPKAAPIAPETETQPEPVPVTGSIDPALDEWAEGYPQDWPHRAFEILQRDKHTCQALGCYSKAVDVHHIIPRSKGGHHRADNLVALCRIHHAIVHLDSNKIEVSSKHSKRCTIVSQHWNGNAFVPLHIRRFKRVTAAELTRIREYFGLKCRRCGSTAWNGHLRVSEYTIRIRCPGCNARWKLEAGLREETGAQLAMIFLPTQNVGRFAFDPKLIRGLEPLKAYEGCPECDRNGRGGFLIEKKDTERVPYIGCTLNEELNCPYVRPIDL